MKTRTKVITPVGTYEGHVKTGITSESIDLARQYFERCNELSYFSIDLGDTTVYIPGNVIKNSVIVFNVTE